ncbi:MAG TPA: hypothetical protein PKY59_21325 [Pyrinomonadaceae bacterium]|nr:hypothetical protein [Pyrinomonadaceae bacterium]
MKALKNLLFAMLLTIGLSLAVSAQDNGQGKNPPPKEKPPVVNPPPKEKPPPPKPPDQGGKKPETSWLSSLGREEN